MNAMKSTCIGRTVGGVLIGAGLLIGAVGCDDSRTEVRVASPAYAAPSSYNEYSGEIRFMVFDRYGGYPLSGARVEIHWIGPSGVAWRTTAFTDAYGFGRSALAPVRRGSEPYHAVALYVYHSNYAMARVDDRIHWRMIGPIGSGSHEWRFDHEFSIRLSF